VVGIFGMIGTDHAANGLLALYHLYGLLPDHRIALIVQGLFQNYSLSAVTALVRSG